MKKDLKAAIVQIQLPANSREGEEKIEFFVNKAAGKGVDLVGIPEDCLAKLEEVKAGYDPLSFLSSVAKKHGVYLFGANIIEKGGAFYNAGFLFNPVGDLVHKHHKVVLTPPEEEKGLQAGSTLEVFDTEFGKMSILVCKDSFHRYAAWFFDKIRKAGAEIVLIPSYSIYVSERSVALWTDSIKALAKWFDVYILASGTIGKNVTDYKSFGHSLIVCPKRDVLAEGSGDKEEILVSTLDKESLQHIRTTSGKNWQPDEIMDVEVLEK